MVYITLQNALVTKVGAHVTATLTRTSSRWVIAELTIRNRATWRRTRAVKVVAATQANLHLALAQVPDADLAAARLAKAARPDYLTTWKRRQAADLRARADQFEKDAAQEEALAELGSHGDPAILDAALTLLANGFTGTGEELIIIAGTLI